MKTRVLACERRHNDTSDTGYHVLITYHVPGSVLRALHAPSHWIFKITSQGNTVLISTPQVREVRLR